MGIHSKCYQQGPMTRAGVFPLCERSKGHQGDHHDPDQGDIWWSNDETTEDGS